MASCMKSMRQQHLGGREGASAEGRGERARKRRRLADDGGIRGELTRPAGYKQQPLCVMRPQFAHSSLTFWSGPRQAGRQSEQLSTDRLFVEKIVIAGPLTLMAASFGRGASISWMDVRCIMLCFADVPYRSHLVIYPRYIHTWIAVHKTHINSTPQSDVDGSWMWMAWANERTRTAHTVCRMPERCGPKRPKGAESWRVPCSTMTQSSNGMEYGRGGRKQDLTISSPAPNARAFAVGRLLLLTVVSSLSTPSFLIVFFTCRRYITSCRSSQYTITASTVACKG